jgi:hypothetical protein
MHSLGDNSGSINAVMTSLMPTQFAPLQNDTFLRALLRQPTEYTPLWLMRQAGRYLPEYRATRARAGSFLGLAKNPDFATEVTLQPLDRYDLDAAWVCTLSKVKGRSSSVLCAMKKQCRR